MRYRDARQLQNEDEVIRKSDNRVLIVKSLELFGQYKKALLHCVDKETNSRVDLYHDEVD
jgi:hypothetical protein